jgi:poly(A) polymerase
MLERYHATSHDIDQSQIDYNAIAIIERLKNAGYESYLVGGSVRDLLVKRTPKDYDITTSAAPEAIKKLFGRNCILIGRRFRLAHIRVGKKIFEVATFRAGDTDSNNLIVDDNQWGTAEQDVMRRDFTINGLLYDPHEHEVIDYTGGWEDIHKGVLRTIGNPQTRFLQDPVRMIRLAKFQARFGFSIEQETLQAMHECREMVIKSSPARVLEEMLRMMESGAARPFFELMMHYRMLELVFPWLSSIFGKAQGGKVLEFLEQADEVNRDNPERLLDRSILLACLVFPILHYHVKTEFIDKGLKPHLGILSELTHQVMTDITTSSFSHFPRRISVSTINILTTQFRLTPIDGKKITPHRVQHLHDFFESIAFLKLRCLVNPKLTDIYEQWMHALRTEKRKGRK